MNIIEFFKSNKISLSRFINLCLYEKKKGFYQNNKIGSHFITSPETSQLFGECIAIFFLLLLKNFKINSFCELGPGNGTLMKDLILTINKFVKKPISFYLYEKSEFLKTIQLSNLKKLSSKKNKIKFLNKLEFNKQPVLFICNEFFDALPINQFEKVNNIWFEKRITYSNKFKIINVKTPDIFKKEYKNGDIIEYSPLSTLYLSKILRYIKTYGGGILIFDYGPFEKKNIDTLQAIYKSKKCGILDFPFKSDITYHVNFNNFKKIAEDLNLFFYGPIMQKDFLFFHGINERVINLISKNPSQHKIKILEKQFEKLTSPAELGGLIKCVFVSKEKINSKVFNIR